MARRYLTADEVENTLKRGKAVECFVGRCDRGEQMGFRHLLLSGRSDIFQMRLFETIDRDIENSDVTEWGPLDSALTLGEADQQVSFETLSDCLSHLERAWPGSSQRLVNEGMLQDEYLDYRKTKHRND